MDTDKTTNPLNDRQPGQTGSSLEWINFRIKATVLGILILTIILCVLHYHFLPEKARSYTVFVASYLTNIAATATIFIISAMFYDKFSRYNTKNIIYDALQPQFTQINNDFKDVKQFIENHTARSSSISLLRDFEFSELISQATYFGIAVQGWDGFPRRHHDEIKRLSARGAKIVVITHDETANYQIQTMAQRLVRKNIQCKEEIVETRTNFLRAAGDSANLEFRVSRNIMMHCIIKFEISEKVIYIYSPYSHVPHAVGSIPAILITEQTFPAVFEMFNKEWAFLSTEGSTIRMTEKAHEK